MPYFIHRLDDPQWKCPYWQVHTGYCRSWDAYPVDTSLPARPVYINPIRVFPTRQEAGQALATLSQFRPYTLTFVPSNIERYSWHKREQARILRGEYQPTPWVDQSSYLEPECYFAHMSVKARGKIAYTPTDMHGIEDRQLVVKPGKYLLEVLKVLDKGISKDQVDAWVAQCAANVQGTLQIARTADEIESIYRNGPDSCMKEEFSSSIHPVRVYGDSDLSCAYVGSIDDPSQRAIIWEAQKLYTRIYGTGPLACLLSSAGYQQKDYAFKGAKVRLIRDDRDRIVMPYVDGAKDEAGCHAIGGAKILDSQWIVLGRGDLETNRVDGYAEEQPESSETYYCRHCNENEVDDDEDLCSSCEVNAFVCDYCGDIRFEYGPHGHYCERCEARTQDTCFECEETWIEDREFTEDERRDRQSDGSYHLCRSCARHLQWCDNCEGTFSISRSQCPTCEETETENRV